MPAMIWPDHGVKPPGIEQCKTTYVYCWGRAEDFGATATAAVQAALAAARGQIAQAVADANNMHCPPQGGCKGICRDGGMVRVGRGIDRNIPVKRGGQWVARAWGYESFEHRCRCA